MFSVLKSTVNKVKFLIFLCLIYTANTQINGDTCIMPTQKYGSCVSIKKCKYLSDKFQDVPKPLNSGQIDTLQSYHCGFDSTTPKVCCPTDGILAGSPVETAPSRFGNHRNQHLINQNNCGGKEQSLSQYPWMALIAYTENNETNFRCSGTLINANYILTAAQCLTNLKSAYLVAVRLGEYDLRTEIDCYNHRKCAPRALDLTIGEVIPHELYNRYTMDNDIGLLRLSRPVTFSETIKPVCLPQVPFDSGDLTGQVGIITGWGATASGYSSTQLLKISLPIVNETDCQRRYSLKNTGVIITSKQICAGGIQGKDTCSGDGGAPLGFTDAQGIHVQHGIVSFGSRFCGTGDTLLPGVYTNVSKYLQWILDNIRP